MNCTYQNICGGCPLRHLEAKEYYKTKTTSLQNTINRVNQNNIICKPLVCISDGKRRRAELAFELKKNKLVLGFNAAKTHDVIDIISCPALIQNLNEILPAVRNFLYEFCLIKTSKKIKNKITIDNIKKGDIFLTSAENGIDILIEVNATLTLEHRMCISSFACQYPQVIRMAVKYKSASSAEIILEKTPPVIIIGSYPIQIPCGTFLQASKEGELALITTVLQYIGSTHGNIADLFCGLGTFSYPLANNPAYTITALDSSGESLQYFQKNINALTIHNIFIKQRNLFKYPLDETELKGINTVIFDPPRAGASAQVKKIAAMNFKDKPQKIVAVSCNPHTFVNDANQLISGGYKIIEITPIDQFVYANHLELVALFEKN